MTVCIAIEHAGGVLVACDSFLGNFDERDVVAAPKWWRASGILIAYAGELRVPQLAAAAPKRLRHRRDESDAAYVGRYAEALRALHRARHVALSDTDYLLCYRGGAYVMQSDASLVRSGYGYAAIGEAGVLRALAYSFLREPDLPPRERAAAVLDAEARHFTRCVPPWRFVDLPLPPAPEAVPDGPAVVRPAEALPARPGQAGDP